MKSAQHLWASKMSFLLNVLAVVGNLLGENVGD
jgi:hypothetical protein